MWLYFHMVTLSQPKVFTDKSNNSNTMNFVRIIANYFVILCNFINIIMLSLSLIFCTFKISSWYYINCSSVYFWKLFNSSKSVSLENKLQRLHTEVWFNRFCLYTFHYRTHEAVYDSGLVSNVGFFNAPSDNNYYAALSRFSRLRTAFDYVCLYIGMCSR